MKSRLVAIIICLLLVACSTSSPSQPPSSATPTRRPVPTTPPTFNVLYIVSGSSYKANLTYNNETGGTEQTTYYHPDTLKIPWELEFTADDPNDFLYLSAQNDTDKGTVTCEIRVNGRILQTAESDAKYGIATCSGSAGD